LLCWLLSTWWVRAEQELPSTEKGERLRNELSQKLAALGSFQAEYQGLSYGKPTIDIGIIFNNRERYCLIKASELTKHKPDIYFVWDYSQSGTLSNSFEVLITRGSKGEKGTVSLSEMFKLSLSDKRRPMDNPLGLIFFMAQQFAYATSTNADTTWTAAVGPKLNLEFNQTEVFLGAGFSAGSTNLTASWLAQDLITNVINIVETPTAVEFFYPHNHVVVVDRLTGMLVKDSVPDPKESGVLEIILRSHAVQEDPLPFASVIPKFDKIKFGKMPDKLLLSQFRASYLDSLGRQYATMDNFDEILHTNSAKIVGLARDAARQIMHDQLKAKIDQKAAIKIRDKIFIQAYKDYLKDPPVDIKDLSFTNALYLMSSMIETNPGLMTSPVELKLAERDKRDFRDVVKQLPKNAQGHLLKLYDLVMRGIIQGWELEYVTVTIEKTKTLSPPGLSSYMVDAYSKRGLMEQKSGDLVSAIADYEAALELKPNNSSIKKKLYELKGQMNKEVAPL